MIVYDIQKIGGNNNSLNSLNVIVNCHYHSKNRVITRLFPSMLGSDKYEDPMTFPLKSLQDQYNFCVRLLNAQGYNGDLLAEKLSEKLVSSRANLTVPYSKQCIKYLKSAKTDERKFLATGGIHATRDKFFIAAEKNKREQ